MKLCVLKFFLLLVTQFLLYQVLKEKQKKEGIRKKNEIKIIISEIKTKTTITITTIVVYYLAELMLRMHFTSLLIIKVQVYKTCIICLLHNFLHRV